MRDPFEVPPPSESHEIKIFSIQDFVVSFLPPPFLTLSDLACLYQFPGRRKGFSFSLSLSPSFSLLAS